MSKEDKLRVVFLGVAMLFLGGSLGILFLETFHDDADADCYAREECCKESLEYQEYLMECRAEMSRYAGGSVSLVCLDAYDDWQNWMDELYDENFSLRDIKRVYERQNETWSLEQDLLWERNYDLEKENKKLREDIND